MALELDSSGLNSWVSYFYPRADWSYVPKISSHFTSSFFAGLVFWSSLCCLFRSPFLRHVVRSIALQICRRQKCTQIRDGIPVSENQYDEGRVEDQSEANQDDAERASLGESIFGRQDNPLLVFALTLLFFMSSISQFASSVAYSSKLPSSRRTFCAFLIAWDTMSLQSARLVGLVIVGLALGRAGVRRRESLAFWSTLTVITVLAIAANILGFGSVSPLSDSGAIFCYRKRALAPALALSLLTIITELYAILRLLSTVEATPSSMQRKLQVSIRDIRFVRALSLILFEVIIIAPNSIQSTYLADSVPFSVAALIVLAAFNNYRSSDIPLQYSAPERNTTATLPPEYINRIPSKQATKVTANSNANSLAHSNHNLQSSGSPMSGFRMHRLWPFDRPKNELDVRKEAKGGRLTPPLSPERRAPSKSDPQLHPKTKTDQQVQARGSSNHSRFPSGQIIPKAELARQFNVNEQAIPYSREQVLASRPTAPPVFVPSPKRSKSPTSITYSLAQTTSSTVYGSDIIRPEPGRVVRDKMKLPAVVDRGSAPIESAAYPNDSLLTLREVRPKSTGGDTWVSDRVIDMYALRSSPPAETSTIIFDSDWPIPPSTTPALTSAAIGRHQKRMLQTQPQSRPYPQCPAASEPKSFSTSQQGLMAARTRRQERRSPPVTTPLPVSMRDRSVR
ncbi:hypothetical protein M0805_005455 [Coniferiporia weirii]|nr:hypothetical protein M0805_005455 [Coniferiporia weirii]